MAYLLEVHESLNKTLEDTLDHGRAHSVGAVAQDADLLGLGLGLNALTSFRNQKRQRARAAPTRRTDLLIKEPCRQAVQLRVRSAS